VILFPILVSIFSDYSRDYASWSNAQENITSSAMGCDYKMVWISMIVVELGWANSRSQVDSDYFLPILMERYFLRNPVGQNRTAAFLKSVFLLYT
jgi:hypothetical protein